MGLVDLGAQPVSRDGAGSVVAGGISRDLEGGPCPGLTAWSWLPCSPQTLNRFIYGKRPGISPLVNGAW